MTSTPHTSPTPTRILQDGEGDALWFLDTRSTLKASQAEGAQFDLLEYVMPEGHETPYHLHEEEDEGLYVLEGTITAFLDGDQAVQLGPGSYLHIGRGTAHGFRAKTAGRLLVITGTGQFAELVRLMGAPATDEGLPSPASADLEKLARLAAEQGIRLLGPLPSLGAGDD